MLQLIAYDEPLTLVLISAINAHKRLYTYRKDSTNSTFLALVFRIIRVRELARYG